jgi:hypothetical protein
MKVRAMSKECKNVKSEVLSSVRMVPATAAHQGEAMSNISLITVPQNAQRLMGLQLTLQTNSVSHLNNRVGLIPFTNQLATKHYAYAT